jgi:hydrogenase nickel incorporation protein HypA/HybF
MHELSIVLSVVDLVTDEVRKAGARAVTRIDLEIGTMAGIEFDALDFVWDAGVRGTVLAGAVRHVHRVEARARCSECGHAFGVEQLYEACPKCGGYFHHLLSGQEMRIKSIEVQ